MDKTLWDWEADFVRAIAHMEQNGVAVDAALCRSELALGEATMARIETEVGGKPSSPKFLEKVLMGDLGLPLVRPTKGTKDKPQSEWKPSFDKYAMEQYEEILDRLDNPLAKQILEYRGWQKACSTYYRAFLRNLRDDGRLYPNFKIHGTKTSRLSCGSDSTSDDSKVDSPNLQQIPKVRDERKRWAMKTKNAFIPTWHYSLWEFDYDNLELRIGADLSHETTLIDAFNRGEPIWDFMKEMTGFSSKEAVKTFTYMTAYGAGLLRMSNALGVTQPEAKKLKEQYFAAFPQFYKYGTADKDWKTKEPKGKAAQVAHRQGYITLWTGRRRHFQFEDEYRKAWNAYLQGGSAEIVKRALIRCVQEVCDQNCRLVLTVHDSLVFEIREDMEDHYGPKILRIMSEVPEQAGFKVRYTASMGRWGASE